MPEDPISSMILMVIALAATAAGLFAVLHAATQRSDAYTAAGKLTKPKWVGITAAGTVACALFQFGGVLFILWIGGMVAVLVYLVDVRPKLIEVQRGSR